MQETQFPGQRGKVSDDTGIGELCGKGPGSLVAVYPDLLPDISRGLKKLKSRSMLPSVQA